MNPVLASAAGSELPWYAPILVSLLLILVAGIYRFRHRGEGNGTEPPLSAGIEGEQASLPSPRENDMSSPFLLPRLLP